MSLFKVWSAFLFEENPATDETTYFHSRKYAYVFKNGLDVEKLRMLLLTVRALMVFGSILVLKLLNIHAAIIWALFLLAVRWAYLEGALKRAKRIDNLRPLTMRKKTEILRDNAGKGFLALSICACLFVVGALIVAMAKGWFPSNIVSFFVTALVLVFLLRAAYMYSQAWHEKNVLQRKRYIAEEREARREFQGVYKDRVLDVNMVPDTADEAAWPNENTQR